MGIVKTDTVQATLNLRDIRGLTVPLPPLDEQRRIAKLLGALDDLIDLNRGLMRDLDDLAMALYRSAWDGKSWVPISSLGSVTMGQSPPGSTYNEQGLGMVFFQGVRDFGDRYPRSRVHCTEPTRVADEGDILIAVRAPIGETNVAVERTAFGRGLAALKATRPALALRALRASERTWAPYQGTGTVFSSINGSGLKAAEVPFVDDSALESQLETLDSMHRALAQENEELSAARDELLPLLMSGRVRVGEEGAA
jgi:type I restriction enzyme S subunit